MPTNSVVPSVRLASIDILRGLVMVLMTLDHTRDFFSNAHFSPTNLDKTTPALFLTRWITHFCAPVFIFLAGTSASMWASSRGEHTPISGFLLKRGVLLIILVLTVEAWAWNFLHDFRDMHGGVLWAIGWSMVALAGLVKLPLRWTATMGGLLVMGHNAFDWLKPDDLGAFGPWWAILHTGDTINLGNGWRLNPYYPLIPWIGVMAIGYGFGKCLKDGYLRRGRSQMTLGTAIIVVFMLLRLSNMYGDPKPWQNFPDPTFTVLSFLNCHKYPPSLLYLLMTLGPALVLLGLLESFPTDRLRFLQVFGRTPLFFYIVHLYLIHLSAVLLAYATGGPVSALLHGGIWTPNLPIDYGYGLPTVYCLWLSILLLLYPLCVRFEMLKAANPHWRWTNYL